MRPETEPEAWLLAGDADAARFRHAPMLAARWCLPDRGAFLEVGSGRRYGIAGELGRVLAEAVDGSVVGAVDSHGARWRLRRWTGPDAAVLWALERTEEAQRRTLGAIRAAVGGVLAGAIVHELQNPLNAACLRAELLRTLIERGDGKASPQELMRQVDGLREKLNDLAGSQATLAERWLAPASDEGPASQTLPALLADVAALMRAYYARRGLGLSMQSLFDAEQALDGARAAALRTGLCAALLMLVPEQRESAARMDVSIDVEVEVPDAAPPTLRIALPTASGRGVLRAALEFTTEQLHAALGLMLDRYGVDFEVSAMTSLRLPLAPG